MSSASWTLLLRKHLLERDGGNRACLDAPLPTLFHLISSMQQEGGQLLCPLPKGNPASGGSPSPLRLGSGDACPARSGEALQDGLSGGLVHLSTQMFGHLIKSPSLPSIRHGAVDITQADCAENFQTPLPSSWIGTKMSKKMMNSFKRSTNCSSPK